MTPPTIDQLFNSMTWHDAILHYVAIDRRAPGENDEVLLVVTVEDVQKTLRFTDCRLLHAQMNFGVIAEESVLHACCTKECARLREVQQTWQHYGVSLDDLWCFEFETNSTGSVIHICAPSFQFVAPTPALVELAGDS